MGFYREPESAPPLSRARHVASPSHAKIRVAADSLGASWASNVLNKYGYTSTFKPIAPTITVKPAAPPIKGSFVLPFISTPTTAPAPIPTTTQPRLFSPVAPAPTPTTTAPAVTTTQTRSFSPTSSTPPTSTPSDPTGGGGFIPTPTAPADGGGSVTGSGYVPPPTVDNPLTIRFDSSAPPSMLIPDAAPSGPELYNEDGTPANAAATQASTPTLADKIKSLPTAAKVGGAVLAYILLAR
jgi:hypothetical protein